MGRELMGGGTSGLSHVRRLASFILSMVMIVISLFSKILFFSRGKHNNKDKRKKHWHCHWHWH